MTQQVVACVDALQVPLDLVAKAHALITDPPYSEHVHNNIVSAGTVGGGSRGWHKQTLRFAPVSRRLRTFIARAAARVSGWSVIFSDLESAHLWRVSLHAASVEYIRSVPFLPEADDVSADGDAAPGYFDARPWVRWSQPQKSGDRPTQGSELVTHAWGSKGKRKRWNGPGSLVSYDATALRGSEKHRTQKPLLLMLQLVSWYSNPGETVFDPCAGRGTTGLACRLLERDFWGCELDPVEAALASKRLVDALDARDLREAREFAAAQRAEALAVLALPRTRHPETGKFTDERTRERAERRIADADTCERKIAELAA